MPPRILIPEPASLDRDYSRRSLPPYLAALEGSGAEPILVPPDGTQSHVADLLAEAQGILLPGSKFDVDPQSYGAVCEAGCSDSDPARAAVDELLLQDAFNLEKPILAICYGIQALNVWCGGSLVQDLKTAVNHRPGSHILEAHSIHVAPGTRLAELFSQTGEREPKVNSSHHQAIWRPGDNLVVSAICPDDEVVEAVELDSRTHFVLGVQWHPERTFASSRLSRAIFKGFVGAAVAWTPRQVEDSVAQR